MVGGRPNLKVMALEHFNSPQCLPSLISQC